jgi:hypothetical protein
MRYLVRARVRPGGERSLLQAIEQRTLGKASTERGAGIRMDQSRGASGRLVSREYLKRYPANMDISKMLAELRAEREQINEAILIFERLTTGRGKRRGRPPAWMTVVKRRGRPPGSKNKPKAG